MEDDGSGNYVEGPKVVVFEVSGTIELQSDIVIGGFTGKLCDGNPTTQPGGITVDTGNYITIAGQTAPIPGITVHGATFHIERNCHDILVQHLRFRFGDEGLTGGEPVSEQESWDTLILTSSYWPDRVPPWYSPSNIVIDHCSLSWAIDEMVESGGNDMSFINNIISEALDSELHHKGPHSKGFLGRVNQPGGSNNNLLFANNLIAHNRDRNPRMTGGQMIIANNLIYDHWSALDVVDSADQIKVSIVGNYLKETSTTSGSASMTAGTYETSKIYLANGSLDAANYWAGQIQTDPWNDNSGYFYSCDLWTPCDNPVPEVNRTYSPPLWPAGYTAMNAIDARVYVLANAGARPADRDSVDTRIVNQTENELCAGGCIITSITYSNADCTGVGIPHPGCTGIGTGNLVQNAEGGFPILAENIRPLTIPTNPHQIQSSGYTNLEEWLHTYLEEVEGETTDLTPPILSNSSPSNTLPINTTQTTLSLTTNENATCKYSTTPNTTYDEITNTFTTTGGTTHSTTVTGLSNGNSYDYYIRCIDTANNFNTIDYTISFSVASSPTTYNISNFIQLLTDWLSSISLTADLNNDGIVNTRDLGIMMSNWEG